MFELLPNHKSRRYFDIAYTAVACSCSLATMLEVNWTHTHARAPKTITDRLQRVSNAAARAVSDTRKFDRGMSRIMYSELHWLDVPE